MIGVDLIFFSLVINIWVLWNSDLIEVGEDEKVRILPHSSSRKWMADTYLTFFMAKYKDRIYQISTPQEAGNDKINDGSSELKIELTNVEINNLMNQIKKFVPNRNMKFSNLVIVDSGPAHLAKYLIGESNDTLILSKVSKFLF